MSDELAFYNFIIEQPELLQQLQSAGDEQAMVASAMQIAQANGFDISAEALAAQFLTEPEGELSDEQLDQISGGRGGRWYSCAC